MRDYSLAGVMFLVEIKIIHLTKVRSILIISRNLGYYLSKMSEIPQLPVFSIEFFQRILFSSNRELNFHGTRETGSPRAKRDNYDYFRS